MSCGWLRWLAGVLTGGPLRGAPRRRLPFLTRVIIFLPRGSRVMCCVSSVMLCGSSVRSRSCAPLCVCCRCSTAFSFICAFICCRSIHCVFRSLSRLKLLLFQLPIWRTLPSHSPFRSREHWRLGTIASIVVIPRRRFPSHPPSRC